MYNIYCLSKKLFKNMLRLNQIWEVFSFYAGHNSIISSDICIIKIIVVAIAIIINIFIIKYNMSTFPQSSKPVILKPANSSHYKDNE